MKTIRELSMLTGVTRRTLQEYDRIGLVKPSSRTESGYWMYDDGIVSRLLLIRFLVAAGYSRKQIKQLLENEIGYDSALKEIISDLQSRKELTEQKIFSTKIFYLAARMAGFSTDLLANTIISGHSENRTFDESVAMTGSVDTPPLHPRWWVIIGDLVSSAGDSQRIIKDLLLSIFGEKTLSEDDMTRIISALSTDGGIIDEEYGAGSLEKVLREMKKYFNHNQEAKE